MDIGGEEMISDSENAVRQELEHPAVRDRLVRVAGNILRDRREAEDAAHDAVLQALRAAGRFRAEAEVSTWLHRVAINAALMASRSRKRSSMRLVPGFK